MKGDTELKRAKDYINSLSEAIELLMTSDVIKNTIEPNVLKVIREILRERFNVEIEDYQMLLDSQGKTNTWSERDDQIMKEYFAPLGPVNDWHEEWKRTDSLVLLLGRSKQVIKKHAIRLGFENRLIK